MSHILLVLFLSSHLLWLNFTSLVPTSSFSLAPDLLGSRQLAASRPLQVPCQPPLVLPVRTVLLLLGSQAADCWGNRRSVWGKQER